MEYFLNFPIHFPFLRHSSATWQPMSVMHWSLLWGEPEEPLSHLHLSVTWSPWAARDNLLEIKAPFPAYPWPSCDVLRQHSFVIYLKIAFPLPEKSQILWLLGSWITKCVPKDTIKMWVTRVGSVYTCTHALFFVNVNSYNCQTVTGRQKQKWRGIQDR